MYDNLNPDWAPSLKLGPEPSTSGFSDDRSKRYRRTQERHHKKARVEAAHAMLGLGEDQTPDQTCEAEGLNPPAPSCHFTLMGTLETPPKEEEPEIISQMRTEVQNLLTENYCLKDANKRRKLTPESLVDDNAKVKNFTGLNYVTLMCLFNFLSPHLPCHGNSSLTKFEKMMLVLLKLRHNLSMQFLGYVFNVSTSCVSKTFNEILHVMFCRMKCFIFWPEREELKMTMPMEFRKHFGTKVSIIIDCFEIFIERPSNYLARAETWSNYKHHNTVKFLIGITPQGAVSFLSKGWGGRSTDKMITENCGILNKLIPGDIVLADRGFDIAESVGLMCAEVKIPAFTRGKKQLSPVELEATRKIAHNRIHVERVIGLVRNKYTILQSTIPVDYLHCQPNTVPTIDKITTVCCALSNLCPSVVPFD